MRSGMNSARPLRPVASFAAVVQALQVEAVDLAFGQQVEGLPDVVEILALEGAPHPPGHA